MPSTPHPHDNALLARLSHEVEHCLAYQHDDNYDTSQLGEYDEARHRTDLVGPKRPTPGADLSEHIQRFAEVNDLYLMLGDERSRALLVSLCAYRVLGFTHVKLPRNAPRYWSDIAGAEALATDAAVLPIRFANLTLRRFDLAPIGYDLRVYATPQGVACACIQKQYEYAHGEVRCRAERGDVVIDAGACWGETSVYFAHEVGPVGKVYAFEFIPGNLSVLRRNLEENPRLAARIAVVEAPLWSVSNERVYFVDWGPGSRVSMDPEAYRNAAGERRTLSVDDLVSSHNIGRVDLIKMDIEGAELDALLGAERTLRTWRPKLAISLYHKTTDFVDIPRYLRSLELGYEYYLEHHTIYQNETVLFCVPPPATSAA
jgi:FkbM family methyltransferase